MANCFSTTVFIASTAVAFIWLIIGAIMIQDESIPYMWNLKSRQTNGSITKHTIDPKAYKGNCDPRCVSGCSQCELTCYVGKTQTTYIVDDQPYTIYVTRANCWVDRNWVEEELDKYEIGTTISIHYIPVNPVDFTYEPKHTNFIPLIIGFTVSQGILIMSIIVSGIFTFRKDYNCKCC